MDRNDRDAIASLFDRLADVERRNPNRDGDAETFIRQRIARQPAAPYYLAQTVIVQQQALEAAQERIAELEASTPGRADARGAGVRGGWGEPRARQPLPDQRGAQPQPWGPAAGGGFLAGAAQTALGVASGVLLGNFLAGTFLGGGHQAHAAEQGSDNQGVDEDQGDAGHEFGDDAGNFDFGGE